MQYLSALNTGYQAWVCDRTCTTEFYHFKCKKKNNFNLFLNLLFKQPKSHKSHLPYFKYDIFVFLLYVKTTFLSSAAFLI